MQCNTQQVNFRPVLFPVSALSIRKLAQLGKFLTDGLRTEPGLILCAVRWYLRYSLSLRDVEELLEERGLNVDHTTVWRWVQYYGPELEQRLRRHLKPTNKSWRVDETYVRVKGRWCYLYRAIDSR